MELKTAVELIKAGVSNSNVQHWVDLGSGDGLFSRALASVLTNDSTVVAIDKDEAALKRIPPDDYNNIKTARLDFVRDLIPLADLDGILMANSLHFVKDKVALLSKIRNCLKSNGRIIIIEYDLTIPNPWVPYPISFNKLNSLRQKLDWLDPGLLKTTPSAFHNREIYSALIRLNG